nr:YoaK family protein [Ruminococcus sp. OA3]
MTFIGGFVGIYALMNHCDLFGSAQTANMIGIVTGMIGSNFREVLLRILGLVIYMAGLICAAVVRHKGINIKWFSLGVDAVCALGIGFLPENINHFVALYPLFFMTAVQWNAFQGAEGYQSSCVFSTNNLRQFTESIVEYLYDKDRSHLGKTKFYGAVLLAFHAGAGAGYLTGISLGIRASWVCLIPLLTAAVLVWRSGLPERRCCPAPLKTDDIRSLSASSAGFCNRVKWTR